MTRHEMEEIEELTASGILPTNREADSPDIDDDVGAIPIPGGGESASVLEVGRDTSEQEPELSPAKGFSNLVAEPSSLAGPLEALQKAASEVASHAQRLLSGHGAEVARLRSENDDLRHRLDRYGGAGVLPSFQYASLNTSPRQNSKGHGAVVAGSFEAHANATPPTQALLTKGGLPAGTPVVMSTAGLPGVVVPLNGHGSEGGADWREDTPHGTWMNESQASSGKGTTAHNYDGSSGKTPTLSKDNFEAHGESDRWNISSRHSRSSTPRARAHRWESEQKARATKIANIKQTLRSFNTGTVMTRKRPSHETLEDQALPERRQRRLSTMEAVQNTAHAVKNRKGMVFEDKKDVQKRVRNILLKRPTGPTYYQTGYCQWILHNDMFDNFAQLAVLLNSIWLGIDVDCNNASSVIDSEPIFQVVENLFCIYFFFEVVIRVGAIQNKWFIITDRWLMLDVFLVALMVTETWIFTIIVAIMRISDPSASVDNILGNTSMLRLVRMLKLLRMARMAKLLRSVPELLTMVRAMSAAIRAVFIALGFFVALDYVYAVIFRQVARDTALEDLHFPSLKDTMMKLLIQGAFPDSESLFNDVANEHFLLWVALLTYFLSTTITILNMMIGVLVEVVKSAQYVEQESMNVRLLRDSILQVIREFPEMFPNFEGEPMDIPITKDEFWMLLEQPSVVLTIQQIGVDVEGLLELIDFFFLDRSRMTLVEVVDMVMQLRSANNATVKDVVDFRKYVSHELGQLKTMMTTAAPQLALVSPRPPHKLEDSPDHGRN